MKIRRKKTREITLGNLKLGGNNPILVQSMLKNRIENYAALKKEIENLHQYGCEIIRIAIPDIQAIKCLERLKQEKIFKVPVVADIHFDYMLAIEALEKGAECVRINPGNIGPKERLEKVVEKAIQKKAAIRIGVNSGSIEKKVMKKNQGNIIESLVESTIKTITLFEKMNFHNFKISAKASSVLGTVEAYQTISEKTDYPLHIGITEAGPAFSGSIKSATGLGILLHEGIGDTLRVSLTDESYLEVLAGFAILSSLGIRQQWADLVSCPTCSRTEVDLKQITAGIQRIILPVRNNLKVAVMGCIVNGPGEAKDADIGVAYGKKQAAIFVKGRIIKRVDIENVLTEFEVELKNLV